MPADSCHLQYGRIDTNMLQLVNYFCVVFDSTRASTPSVSSQEYWTGLIPLEKRISESQDRDLVKKQKPECLDVVFFLFRKRYKTYS